MELPKFFFYNIRYEKRWQRAKKILYEIVRKIEWYGQSHVMSWGKIDNTYRKNINESTWWTAKSNFEISKQQIAELKNEINELRQNIEHA